MRKLHPYNLLRKYSDIKISGNENPVITSITCDSRNVKKDSLFVAVPGTKIDGKTFIDSAIKDGASAILCDADLNLNKDICLIKTSNVRKMLSLCAAEFYDKQPENIVAITGTNGKTSTAHFCRQIWEKLGYKSASVGTIGVAVSEGVDFSGSCSLTTPDPVKLHEILYELAEKQVDHLAVEASSHGIDQYRLSGVKVRAAAFTNITRDHLDYHGTFENYFEAKSKLFSEVMGAGGVVVLNADIAEYPKLLETCKKMNHKVITYGYKAQEGDDIYKSIRIISISCDGLGQNLVFKIGDHDYQTRLGLIGEFQVYNILCALALVIACDDKIDETKVVSVLELIKPVPGRMEQVGHSNIFVDYAHTPDALEKTLNVLRPYAKGKLYVVFGCGGERDKGKRPQMGEIASKLADYTVITDDNPRSEDPDVIRSEIMASCPDAINIGDRKEAIHNAVSKLQADDILLIAGKGHEKTQIMKDKILDSDDVLIAQEALSNV